MLIFTVKLIQDQTKFNICFLSLLLIVCVCVSCWDKHWDSASKRQPLSSVLDIQGEGGRLSWQTLYPLSHFPSPIFVFFYLFHVIYRIKVLLDRFSQAIRQPSETKKNCKWSTHRKISNGCLHVFVVIACSWKSCDLRCSDTTFFPLENIWNSRNVVIHSFLRFLLNTN